MTEDDKALMEQIKGYVRLMNDQRMRDVGAILLWSGKMMEKMDLILKKLDEKKS